MSRQLRDAISDSTAQLRRSPPSSPRNSILLHKEKAGLQSSVQVLMVLAVLVGTLFIGCIISNDNLNEKISTMERLREELRLTQAGINAQIQRNQRRYNSDVTSYSNAASMDDQVKSLKAYIEQLTLSLADERKVTTQTKQDLDLITERAREVEFASSQQKQVLITALQGIARRQAQYEFGPGPYYALFTLNITGHGVRQFVVEFASLDFMPVTVNNFLQQIQLGLWDDSSFYLKASHVLAARPLSWDLQRSKRDMFGDLLHLPFPEYSNHVPHVKYTLGLNGLSSGPDFFINLVDNSLAHGPRGTEADESGDPCFAAVIIGQETVDLLGQLSTHGDTLLLEHAVQIVQVKIIEELDEVRGGREYLAKRKVLSSDNRQ